MTRKIERGTAGPRNESDPYSMYIHDVGEVYAAQDKQAVSRRLMAAYTEAKASGDANRIQQAETALIHQHLPMVISSAKYYAGKYDLPIDDLISEGNIGLMRALKKFDPDRGVKFSTYAIPWIRSVIFRYIQEQFGGDIHIPTYVNEGVNKIIKTTKVLHGHLGREPTLQEVAAATGMPAEEIKELLNLPSSALTDPLLFTGEMTVAESHVSSSAPEDSVIAAIDFERFKEEMRTYLTPREYTIVEGRYVLDKTLEEIGQELGGH